jgi:hypothetical protein
MSSSLRSKLILKAVVFGFVILLIALFLFFHKNRESFVVSLPNQTSELVVEFAGRYYMGDGLGMNCSFAIEPDLSFHISWSNDTGHKVNYNGSISFANGQFILTPIAEVASPAFCYNRTFIPINWGERKYLLPNDGDEVSNYITSTFCKRVKNGDEPRVNIYGFSYLRTTDITSRVTGFPRRPDGRLQCPVFAGAQ